MIREALRATKEHLSNFIAGDRHQAFEDSQAEDRAAANDDLSELKPGLHRTEAQQLDDRARAIAHRGKPGDVPITRDTGEIREDLLRQQLDVSGWQMAFALLWFGVAQDEGEAKRMGLEAARELHGLSERIRDGAIFTPGEV